MAAAAHGQIHASDKAALRRAEVRASRANASFDAGVSKELAFPEAQIRASVDEPQSWRISAGVRRRGRPAKGESLAPYFEVRTADPGVRVHFCYYSAEAMNSVLRRPYCCYLSMETWEGYKELTFQTFALRVIARIKGRKAKPKAAEAKLDALIRTIKLYLR